MYRTNHLVLLSLICQCALFLMAEPALAIGPSFTGIGDLPGSTTTSAAVGISGNGQTVVGSGRGESGLDEAIRWDNGLITPLGSFPQRGIAIAASYDADFIVGRTTSPVQSGYWSNGALVDIGKLPGGCTDKDVYGVSGIGNKIVGQSCSSLGREAFVWQNGIMTGLGDLPGGDLHSEAFNISYDGNFVVGTGHTSQGFEAFRWSNGAMIGLGDLPGGDFGTFAWDVSADGSTVVGNGKSAASFPLSREAFRWHNGVMSPLGFLSGFGNRSEANAVSADGNVVVGFSGRSDLAVQIAFIWTPSTGMRNLKTVLQSDYGLDLTGWTLKEATDISYDGMTITGRGINPSGGNESWVVRLPEPSSLSLLLIGLVACRHRKAKHACSR